VAKKVTLVTFKGEDTPMVASELCPVRRHEGHRSCVEWAIYAGWRSIEFSWVDANRHPHAFVEVHRALGKAAIRPQFELLGHANHAGPCHGSILGDDGAPGSDKKEGAY
jgi:hypothetical protein